MGGTMKIFNYFAAFFLLTSSFAAGNGNLKGKVTDKVSEEPLVGVNVIILNQFWGAATDTKGEYVIKNIPQGTYSVKVSYVGYSSKTIHDVIIENKETSRLDIKLETDFILPEIVVLTKKPMI